MSVVKFYHKDAGKEIDNVLEQALGIYEDALIIGWNKEGHLEARSNTTLTRENLLFLVEMFKHKMLSGDYDE